MTVWDQKVLLDTSLSATPSGVTALEIPPDADDMHALFTQSGTATTITIQGAIDNSNFFNLCSTASATLHAITTIPRYVRAITEGTADSHVVVQVQYRKP